MGPLGPSRCGFCLRDASVSDTAPIRTREGLPSAPTPAPRAPSEHDSGGVSMHSRHAVFAWNFWPPVLRRPAFGMKAVGIPVQKLLPGMAWYASAKDCSGDGRRFNCRGRPTKRPGRVHQARPTSENPLSIGVRWQRRVHRSQRGATLPRGPAMTGSRFGLSSAKSGLRKDSPRWLAAAISANAATPSGAMRKTLQLESEVWR